MRIVHLSDLHLLNLDGVPWTTLVRDKRVTGFLNLVFARRREHRPSVARDLAARVREAAPDHVVITGDLTNLALEPEMREAQSWLANDIGLPPDRISVVPGNHDRYTKAAVENRCFDTLFAPYMGGHDRPGFPYVHHLGAVVLIGVDTAVPQPPFIAAGQIDARQMQSLREALDPESLNGHTPIVLLHHPPRWERSWLREWIDGLRDAPALQAALPSRPGLILHGHRHRSTCTELRRGNARWLVVGAPSASDVRAAAFNTIEMNDGGELVGIESTDIAGHSRRVWP